MRVKMLTREKKLWAWVDVSGEQAEKIKQYQGFSEPWPDDGTLIERSNGRPGEYGAQGWTGLLIDQHSLEV